MVDQRTYNADDDDSLTAVEKLEVKDDADFNENLRSEGYDAD